MTDTTRAIDIDILINRQNIALARSQRLLQSWLPPKPSDQPATPAAESDPDDFHDLGEATGIGAKRIHADDVGSCGIPKRSRTDNEKLLENLIGKKAAHARKKAPEAGKGRHAAPNPREAAKQKPVSHPVESEDEEEGRASAFVSKKQKQNRSHPRTVEVAGDAVAGGEEDEMLREDAEPPDPRGDATVVKEWARAVDDGEAEGARPKKRKAGSYLDELLAQKAKKKKKKRHKKKENGESDV